MSLSIDISRYILLRAEQRTCSGAHGLAKDACLCRVRQQNWPPGTPLFQQAAFAVPPPWVAVPAGHTEHLQLCCVWAFSKQHHICPAGTGEDWDVNKPLPGKVVLPGEPIYESPLNILWPLLFLPSSSSYIQSTASHSNFFCSFYESKIKEHLKKIFRENNLV